MNGKIFCNLITNSGGRRRMEGLIADVMFEVTIKQKHLQSGF